MKTSNLDYYAGLVIIPKEPADSSRRLSRSGARVIIGLLSSISCQQVLSRLKRDTYFAAGETIDTKTEPRIVDSSGLNFSRRINSYFLAAVICKSLLMNICCLFNAIYFLCRLYENIINSITM